MSQVRDVVLVMCIFSSGKPQGAGILEWGVYGEGDGNGEISLRATWDRGGQDPITEARGLLHNCTVRSIFMYIVNVCNCLNDCQSIYVRIKIVGYECS